MRATYRYWLVAVALLLAASHASAAFNFTSQNRFVTGTLSGSLGGAGPQTITSPGFGIFDATTNLTVPTYGGAANQYQHSELLPNAILVNGDADIFRPAEVGTGSASCRSLTDVTFDVTESTAATFAASGVAFSGGIPFHSIKLTGPSTNVSWDQFGSGFPVTTGSKSTDLTLAPGSYRLIVDLQSFNSNISSNNHGVFDWNVSLTVPEPGCLALLAIAPALVMRRRRC